MFVRWSWVASLFPFKKVKHKKKRGASLVAQRLGLGVSMAGGTGSIPGWATHIPRATWCSQKRKKTENDEIACGGKRREGRAESLTLRWAQV